MPRDNGDPTGFEPMDEDHPDFPTAEQLAALKGRPVTESRSYPDAQGYTKEDIEREAEEDERKQIAAEVREALGLPSK